jgi:hypothetical protein
MAQTPTGIELRAKVFPLAFILYLFQPTIEIDGQAYPAKWGTQFFPVAPGNHSVTLYFKYLFMAQCNKAATGLTVAPGQVAVVTYKSRWLVFLPGKVEVGTASGTGGAGAGTRAAGAA